VSGPGQPTTPRKVELGPALNTDDADLDMAALITPADIEAAKSDMARRGSGRLKALLDAARVEAPGAADVSAPAIPSD